MCQENKGLGIETVTHRNLTLQSSGETQISGNKVSLQGCTALWSQLTTLTQVCVLDGSERLLPSLSSCSYSSQQPNSCSLHTLAFSAPLFLLRKTTLSWGRRHCWAPWTALLHPPAMAVWDPAAPAAPRDSPTSSPQLLSHVMHTAASELRDLHGIISPGGNIFRPSCSSGFFQVEAWKALLLKVSKRLHQLG